MIATSHVIIGGAVGAAVGVLTQNPAAALAAGIVSHLVCDLVPHADYPPNTKFINDEIVWDKSLYIFAITDSGIAFLLTLMIWIFKFDFNFAAPFAWGALGGYLPDLLDNFPFWRFQIRQIYFFRKFHALHKLIHDQWRFRYPMPQYWILGTVTQLVTAIPCLWYILK